MIAFYIIIGVAVGAVAIYLWMDKRMDALNITVGKKDIELAMKGEQLAAMTSRSQHLDAENQRLADKAESLGAKSETLSRELELVRQQMAEAEQRHERQMAEELERREAQFKNMAQQLMEASSKTERTEHGGDDGDYPTAEGGHHQYAEGHQRDAEGECGPLGLVPRTDDADDAADPATR